MSQWGVDCTESNQFHLFLNQKETGQERILECSLLFLPIILNKFYYKLAIDNVILLRKHVVALPVDILYDGSIFKKNKCSGQVSNRNG